jgi:hypothetical protein
VFSVVGELEASSSSPADNGSKFPFKISLGTALDEAVRCNTPLCLVFSYPPRARKQQVSITTIGPRARVTD